jgi:hypothetical protein
VVVSPSPWWSHWWSKFGPSSNHLTTSAAQSNAPIPERRVKLDAGDLSEPFLFETGSLQRARTRRYSTALRASRGPRWQLATLESRRRVSSLTRRRPNSTPSCGRARVLSLRQVVPSGIFGTASLARASREGAGNLPRGRALTRGDLRRRPNLSVGPSFHGVPSPSMLVLNSGTVSLYEKDLVASMRKRATRANGRCRACESS